MPKKASRSSQGDSHPGSSSGNGKKVLDSPLTQPNQTGQRLDKVGVSPEELRRVMKARRMGVSELAQASGISRNSIYNLLSGESVKWDTLAPILDALEVSLKILQTGSEAPEKEGVYELVPPLHWTIERVLGTWRETPNGLNFRVVRLRHEHLTERIARGKFYDVSHLPSREERERFREAMLRHARVCEKVGVHPHIAANMDVRRLEDASGWWVLDRWVDGVTLEASYDDENSMRVLPFNTLHRMGAEILLGLRALHEAKVIFRELAPDKVWIASEDGHVVLTDFELCRLMDNSPSVSSRWKEGDFRAPEVSDNDAFPASDLFSWARVMRWCLKGGSTGELREQDWKPVPPSLRTLLEKCQSSRPSKRPRSVNEVLECWIKGN